jgi:hypothetical protein
MGLNAQRGKDIEYQVKVVDIKTELPIPNVVVRFHPVRNDSLKDVLVTSDSLGYFKVFLSGDELWGSFYVNEIAYVEINKPIRNWKLRRLNYIKLIPKED